MDPVTVGAIVGIGKHIIRRLFPDPADQWKAEKELLELEQKGELAELDADTKLALGQLAINQAEAQHPSIFVAGWRPAVGWVCVVALAYHYLIYPFMLWVAFLAAVALEGAPELDMTDLLILLGGLLGIGGFRTVEKIRKVARERILPAEET